MAACFIVGFYVYDREPVNWLFVVPPLAVLGGGVGCLIQFDDAVFHYGFYLLATVLLRWVAGLGWVWNITS